MVKNKDVYILFLLLTPSLHVMYRNMGLIFTEPSSSFELPF